MFGSFGIRLVKRVGLAAASMALAILLAFLAFHEPIGHDVGRGQLLTNIVKSAVEHLGPTDSAALFLIIGTALALVTLLFSREG